MIPLLEAVRPYIYHYGYWAIFFGVFLESLGMPLPGETLIIVAGLMAAKGVLNIGWLGVSAIIATFIANNISYALGYRGGHQWLVKYGKYFLLNEKRILVLEDFFKHHGTKVVVIARFIIGMRQFNGFIAGIARMPLVKFIIFNLIGAILWVVVWMGLAYYLGKNFNAVFIKYYFVFGLVALGVLIIVVYRFLKKDSNTLLTKTKPVPSTFPRL